MFTYKNRQIGWLAMKAGKKDDGTNQEDQSNFSNIWGPAHCHVYVVNICCWTIYQPHYLVSKETVPSAVGTKPTRVSLLTGICVVIVGEKRQRLRSNEAISRRLCGWRPGPSICKRVISTFGTDNKVTVGYPPDASGLVVLEVQVGVIIRLTQQVVEVLQADEVVFRRVLHRQVVADPRLRCRPADVEGVDVASLQGVTNAAIVKDTGYL